MSDTLFNLFDLGVVLIIGLSTLLSFYRGFLREVVSLGSWVGASVLTLIALPTVTKFIEPQVKSVPIATAIASVATFIVALIIISIATGLLVKFLRSATKIGLIDNLLGLAFGAVRGGLIVAIGYFIMTIVIVEKDYPDWVKDAKTRPYVARAAATVAKLIPNMLRELMQKDPANKADTAKKVEDTGDDDKKINLDEIMERDKLNRQLKGINSIGNAPSIEDLQKRIKQENEKNNVR